MNTWVFGVSMPFENGRYRVSVRDLPEVVTSGRTETEALGQAVDAIEISIGLRIRKGEALPVCSPVQAGEHAVSMSARATVKAAVYETWREAGITKSELARRMGRDIVEVRRILEPGHGTKIDQLEEAVKALGKRLTIGVAA